MDFTYEQPELEAEVEAARTFDALEAAFVKVWRLTATLNDPKVFGRKLFWPGLDAAVPNVARRLRLAATPEPRSNERVCILATQFYSTGGHSRVAKDFIDGLGPEKAPTIILSNAYGAEGTRYRNLLESPGIRTWMNEHALLILSGRSFVEKAIELHMMLKAMRPTRIVLMTHPFDISAVVGCWAFRDIVEFVHHVDHLPSLGATLPYAAHVDVTYTCHRACRDHGLAAVYAGMTSAVTDVPAHTREPRRLRLATCGDQRKYVAAGRHRWIDYALAAMRLPGAEMLHIGPMSEEFRQEVHQALAAEGLDPARYVFMGSAPSLPRALIEHQTDVYLSSYPASGGKTNLEAMLADRPIIVPIEPDMAPLLRFDLPLPGFVVVAGPDELAAAIPRALALGEAMGDPERLAIRDREVTRFAGFVAGEPLAPA